MAATLPPSRKRKTTRVGSGRKFKRQKPSSYHSSSSEAESEQNLQDQNETSRNTVLNTVPPSDSDDELTDGHSQVDGGEPALAPNSLASDPDTDSELDALSQTSSSAPRKLKKRCDPSAFAASIAAILGSSAPRTDAPDDNELESPIPEDEDAHVDEEAATKPVKSVVRKKAKTSDDPVLSRSRDARLTASQVQKAHLDSLTRRKVRQSKEALRQKGHISDVILGTSAGTISIPHGDEEGTGEGQAAAIAERERRLKKTAQRGVVRLFNAVRAAQVRGEEVARGMMESKRGGGNAVGRRTLAVDEGQQVSKEGFLAMIAGGGKRVSNE